MIGIPTPPVVEIHGLTAVSGEISGFVYGGLGEVLLTVTPA